MCLHPHAVVCAVCNQMHGTICWCMHLVHTQGFPVLKTSSSVTNAWKQYMFPHISSQNTSKKGTAYAWLRLQPAAYATNTHAPPFSLIFFSANLEKNLALTTTGWGGNTPLPNTLNTPCLVTSMTAAWPLFLAASSRACGRGVCGGGEVG